MRIRFTVCITTGMILPALLAAGQVGPDTTLGPHFARLTIGADVDSSFVFLDSLLIGRTPCMRDSLLPGRYVVRVASPDLASWFGGTVADTITIREGETRSLRFSVRPFLSVVTQPDGADLYVNDSLAGTTPLLLRTSGLAPGSLLSVRKDGYDSATLRAGDIRGAIVALSLTHGLQSHPPEPSPYLALPGGWNSRTAGLYASGGVAVIAGIASAYFKIAADERQASFEETGNPAFLSDRRRLDTWAGVCFALTQVGLAIFSYLLISD